MPVTRSKDCTQVTWEDSGIKMMKIFQKAPTEVSIFNDFSFMD